MPGMLFRICGARAHHLPVTCGNLGANRIGPCGVYPVLIGEKPAKSTAERVDGDFRTVNLAGRISPGPSPREGGFGLSSVRRHGCRSEPRSHTNDPHPRCQYDQRLPSDFLDAHRSHRIWCHEPHGHQNDRPVTHRQPQRRKLRIRHDPGQYRPQTLQHPFLPHRNGLPRL